MKVLYFCIRGDRNNDGGRYLLKKIIKMSEVIAENPERYAILLSRYLRASYIYHI